MDDLLLLAHRLPYPPNKGDKIRSYHLLRQLARFYRVHLGTFIDDAEDWRHAPAVQALCASTHIVPLAPLRARLRSLGALAFGRPLSLDYYRDRGLRDWIGRTMRERQVKRVVVFSAAMAQYVEDFPEDFSGVRCLIDFCDIDSEKWRQYAVKKAWPLSWLYRYEAGHLLAYERRMALRCDAALFVSRQEAELFRHLAPESAARVGHVGNGVDTRYFSPDQAGQDPYAPGQVAIVFTGAMDYWPNVDAVAWFAREILPLVRLRHPGARFHIVGARPSAAVQQLSRLDGVSVSGTVSDVRPWLAHAALAVAPLRVARGIQNKVLEAMAMGKTVVLTPQALEGIEARPDAELLVAADARGFADTVCASLERPDPAIGRAARACVEAGYGWAARLAPLLPLLEGEGVHAPAAQAVVSTINAGAALAQLP